MLEIKPVPIDKKEEFLNLLRQVINKKKQPIKEQIKDLNLDLPLDGYFTIEFDTLFLKRAVISSSLPEWLKDFLESCFMTAQEQLLEDIHKQ